MISKYHVVECTALEDLIRYTQQRIDMGWQPLGGIAIRLSQVSNTTFYLQALTKED